MPRIQTLEMDIKHKNIAFIRKEEKVNHLSSLQEEKERQTLENTQINSEMNNFLKELELIKRIYLIFNLMMLQT